MSSKDDVNELVDVLCEFLQAVIAAILYVRSVYDRDLFQLHRLYGVAVQKCRHPDLNDYIESNIRSLREAIKKGQIKKVAVTISDADGVLLERHSLHLKMRTARVTPGADELESLLRGCLVKLHNADGPLPPLPPGSSFELEAHVTDRSALPFGTWVEDMDAGGAQPDSIIPIRTGRTEGSTVQLQLVTEVFAGRVA